MSTVEHEVPRPRLVKPRQTQVEKWRGRHRPKFPVDEPPARGAQGGSASAIGSGLAGPQGQGLWRWLWDPSMATVQDALGAGSWFLALALPVVGSLIAPIVSFFQAIRVTASTGLH